MGNRENDNMNHGPEVQQTSSQREQKKIYKIYSIIEKPGNQKDLWLDIGVGSRNRDGSITCKIDCLPLNGVVHVRDYEPRNQKKPASFGRNDNHLPPTKWQEGGY